MKASSSAMEYEIVNSTQRCLFCSLCCCDLCQSASGETQSSVSGSTHPSFHRAQAPPRATPNPRTLHPPWDETWPHTSSSLPGASKELLASTRLTGRRFSLKSNHGERTHTWMARQIDGSADSQVDT